MLIEVVLGVSAGIVTGILFLVTQVTVSGSITVDESLANFERLAVVGSMASLFAALYLDSALQRFDKVQGSVMEGKHGS
jgi:hypothetical protein